jgi:hypothetical protein
MQTRKKIRFYDKFKVRRTVLLSQLGVFTGRRWLDLDYLSINESITADSHLQEYLTNPFKILKSLEIRYMNDQVGYGLYASEDIPRNTIIGFVTGEIKKFKAEDIGFDSNDPTAHIKSGSVTYDSYGNVYIIDSSKQSNHTHYIQHLPSSETVKRLPIDKNEKIMLCTSNLSEHELKYNELDLTYFKTNRIIRANELIGCSYRTNGNEAGMKSYCFFKKNGEIVDQSTLIKASDYPKKKLRIK